VILFFGMWALHTTFEEMLDKIWVGAVSYLNTKPLVRAFEQGAMADQIYLVTDYPSKLADRLKSGELDVALLPVAALEDIEDVHIFSPYGIASKHKVASVSLFSQVPLSEIKEIYLDYQSRTSVALLRILCKEHWNIQPKFIEAEEGYINQIEGERAGLIIGDRAFECASKFPHIYDLAESWKEFKNLPFVFAVWVGRSGMSQQFVEDFNRACALGLAQIDDIVAEQNYAHYDLSVYYNENISYNIGAAEHKAIELYRQYVREIKLYS